MTFLVHELPKAKADKRHIFGWLHERSPTGAGAWLSAYDGLVEQIQQRADTFGEAYENRDLELDVRQGLFKTCRGRVDRILFFLEDQHAYILRVRGPGQAAVRPNDLDAPDR